MLPFLKNKQDSVAGTIIKNRTPDKDSDSNDLEDKEHSLEDCAKRIISAVHSNDAKALADALQEAIDKPKESKDKPSPHTYEAQNIKAASEE